MVARREWTRQWWDEQAVEYELATSAAVLDELSQGDYPTKKDVLQLMERVPVLPIDEPIADIVSTYLQHKLMPADPVGDALHLAVASYHKCDFLLTWNSRHLANANKFAHIRRINTMLGLFVPMLVTPLELMGGVEL